MTIKSTAGGIPSAPIIDPRPALAVTIGRFQPLHDPHVESMHAALGRAEHLLVQVGSPFRARSHRNPLTFDERKAMILDSLRAEEAGRVTVVPVRDTPYNEEKWLAAVQTNVSAQAAALGIRPNKGNVVLAGHAKDGTSYYLKRFPQYGQLRLPNIGGVNATDIRESLFAGKAAGARWLHGEGRKLLPSTSVDFLDRFLSNPAYEELVAEYEWARRYRKQWAAAPFPPFFVTVDAVVVQSGHVLMIRRKDFPGRGLWALPGGFVKHGERLEDAMIREAREETRLRVPGGVLRGHIRAERVFDDPHRSSRGRTITHAYLIHLPPGELPEIKAGSDAAHAEWRPIAEVREDECFEDHFYILHEMLARIL